MTYERLTNAEVKIVAELTHNFSGAKSYPLAFAKDCSVVTTYAPISTNFSRLKEMVQTVSLQFNYKSEDKILLLPFYILTIHPQSELKERAKRARAWQTRVSRSLIENGYGRRKQTAGGPYRVPVYRETKILTYKNERNDDKFDTIQNTDYL